MPGHYGMNTDDFGNQQIFTVRVMLLLFSEISFQLLDHQVKLDLSVSTISVSSVAVDFWFDGGIQNQALYHFVSSAWISIGILTVFKCTITNFITLETVVLPSWSVIIIACQLNRLIMFIMVQSKWATSFLYLFIFKATFSSSQNGPQKYLRCLCFWNFSQKKGNYLYSSLTHGKLMFSGMH